MEQRIGSSSKPPAAEPLKAEPVTGAGFDPAFIPGLTGPTPTGPTAKGREPEEPAADGTDGTEATGKATADDAAVEDPARSASPEAVSSEAVSSEAVSSEAGVAEEKGAEEKGDDEKADGDGPVFEASDRRARIVADRKGVRLSLDEEACEFRWDEIAAVETESPRFGKRYTITVHTPDRRWFPIEIEAAARARFKEWDEQLDTVLDAYFEES
ncbi:hypothetical protein [Streptomyces echinatus]|uniref:Uncharacterized protein n=1 Tax=Streptomyces echinatus TaxID=67293 RepID=A0A7W9PTC1_9ACTN|nr:hypothetical protein [Streptomyces echinatus]MBB5927608.1 hypothetical protein [Streptomyces echinatus]